MQYILFIIVICCIIVGCKNDNTTPAPTNNVYVSDTGDYTGKLLVRVYRNQSSGSARVVQGASVALYATFQDFENDIYLSEFITDKDGWVNFGYLNYGNYYVNAKQKTGDTTYIQRLKIAQIQSGRTLERNIYLPQ